MRILSYKSENKLKDRIKNKCTYKKLEITPVEDKMKENRER